MARRRRRSLGHDPAEHSQEMKRYMHAASDLFDRASRSQNCRTKLEQLFEANGLISRAYENYNANSLMVSSKTRQELDSLNKRIRNAVRDFADSSCPRTGR